MKLTLSAILRPFKVGYGWSLLIFVVLQVVFLFLVHTDLLPKWLLSGGDDNVETAFLVVSVHITVAINTILFFLHSTPYVSQYNKAAENMQKSTKNAYETFVVSLIISVFISGGLALLMILSLLGTFMPVITWVLVLKLNEGLCVLLFGLFLLADICCLSVCREVIQTTNELSESERSKVERFMKTVKLYILACDGPGLFGVVLIFIISSILHRHVSDFYWHGFVAGAIGLHIAFSQTVLALLSIVEEQV